MSIIEGKENQFQTETYTAQDAFAITPSDTVNFTRPCRAIYVGAAGTLVIVTLAGNAVTFAGATAGSVIPVAAKRVNQSSTTASSLVGLL